MRLRHFLLAIFSLVAAVPLLLFWLWPQSQALQNELDAVRERHLLVAQSLSATLQRYYQDLTATFTLLAANLAQHGEVTGAGELLAQLHVRQLCLVEPDTGRTTGGPTDSRFACPRAFAADRLALFRTIAGDGVPAFSPVMRGPEDEPVLYLVMQQGDRLVVGALSTEYLAGLAQNITFGQRGHAIIVDRDGKVLAHPLPRWRRLSHDLSQLAPVQAIARGRSGIMTYRSPSLDVEMIAGYAAVPGAGWGVVVTQPVAELHQRADSIRYFVLIVIAAGVLLAALIGQLVSLHMTRPLRAIARAAGRMAKGDLSARALVHASPFLPREMGDLQRTFNVMAEAVERSRREQAAARRKAEDANRSKSEFLANMGHELRTPLNAILGFSDMMLSGTFGPLGSPRYRDYLEYIQSSARHLLSLMNGLLDHARIEAGALRLEEAFLDIGEVMQTSAAMFRDSARRGSIGFRVLPPQPQVHLFADERAMRQILINLLSNAVRYTPTGGQVTLAAELGPAGELAIYVADTGPGIPEDDLARVMEPFERVERRDGRNIEGTGLGLSIVKQLVERQGGIFELHSVEGEGTVARTVFPRERVTHERVSAKNA